VLQLGFDFIARLNWLCSFVKVIFFARFLWVFSALISIFGGLKPELDEEANEFYEVESFF